MARYDEIREELTRARAERDRHSARLTELAADPDGYEEELDRIQRAYQREIAECERLEDELRDEILRAATDPRRIERGDGGPGEPYRDRGAERLAAGLPQHGRPIDDREEQAVIERAMRLRDDAVRRRQLSEAGGENIEYLLRAERSENYDPGYVARRLEITSDPDYIEAFWRSFHAIARGRPANLSQREVDALRRFEDLETAYARAYQSYATGSISRAMSEYGANSAGLGIPGLIDPSIILTSGAADVPLLRVCRIETVTTNMWKGLASEGVVWSYHTEATESTDAAPTLVQPTVAIHTARAFIPYSIEASQDMVNFASEITQLINSGYNDLLATKTMQGSGTGEPFGIFTDLAARGAAQVALTSDGIFQGSDVFKIWNELPERARGNAVWVMSTHVQSAIRQFAATQSSTSAYFTIDLTGGTFRINERPVILTDYAPTFANGVPGTTGAANVLAVGDWRRSYLWANRAGMSVDQIPWLMGPTNRYPTMERALIGWVRNGGGIVDGAAHAKILLNT